MQMATMPTDHPRALQTEELLHQQDHLTGRLHRRDHLMGLPRLRAHLADLRHQRVSRHQTFHHQDPLQWKVVQEVVEAADIAAAEEAVEEVAEAVEDDSEPKFF
jgi:hypothetical protein